MARTKMPKSQYRVSFPPSLIARCLAGPHILKLNRNLESYRLLRVQIGGAE